MNASGIEGVVFLSGDRHFCAGYQILGRWLEFTSGPLGSPNEKNPVAALSPETFSMRNEWKMWMVLEIDTSGPESLVSYEIWAAGEGLVERRNLASEEVSGLAKVRVSDYVAGLRAR